MAAIWPCLSNSLDSQNLKLQLRACMHIGLRAVFQTYTQLLAGKKKTSMVDNHFPMLHAPVYCNIFFTETACKSQEQSLEIKAILAFSGSVKSRHNMPSYNLDSSDRPQTVPTPGWVVYLARVAWTSPAKRPSTIQTCCCSARTPLEISGKQISAIEPNLYTPCIDRCTRKIFMHMVFRCIYDRQAITKRNLDNSVNI